MSCERASEWTTVQLQACSKESTVLLWMLFKRVDQASLVLSRRAPSLSGHFRIAKKTTSLSLATLDTLQKASPAIGEMLQDEGKSFIRVPQVCGTLMKALFQFIPQGVKTVRAPLSSQFASRRVSSIAVRRSSFVASFASRRSSFVAFLPN